MATFRFLLGGIYPTDILISISQNDTWINIFIAAL